MSGFTPSCKLSYLKFSGWVSELYSLVGQTINASYITFGQYPDMEGEEQKQKALPRTRVHRGEQ